MVGGLRKHRCLNTEIIRPVRAITVSEGGADAIGGGRGAHTSGCGSGRAGEASGGVAMWGLPVTPERRRGEGIPSGPVGFHRPGNPHWYAGKLVGGNHFCGEK